MHKEFLQTRAQAEGTSKGEAFKFMAKDRDSFEVDLIESTIMRERYNNMPDNISDHKLVEGTIYHKYCKHQY